MTRLANPHDRSHAYNCERLDCCDVGHIERRFAAWQKQQKRFRIVFAKIDTINSHTL